MSDPRPVPGGLTEVEVATLAEAVPDLPFVKPGETSECPSCNTLAHALAPAVERIIAARTDAADREVARVAVAVEAELDAIWRESQQDHQIIHDAGIMQDCVDRLRAALLSVGEKCQACREGVPGYIAPCTCDPSSAPVQNPYRAALRGDA